MDRSVCKINKYTSRSYNTELENYEEGKNIDNYKAGQIFSFL